MQYLTVPSVAPRFFAGLHTALIFCIIGIVATEYLAGTEGIGYLLQDCCGGNPDIVKPALDSIHCNGRERPC